MNFTNINSEQKKSVSKEYIFYDATEKGKIQTKVTKIFKNTHLSSNYTQKSNGIITTEVRMLDTFVKEG